MSHSAEDIEEKSDKVSNVIDLTLVIASALAYMIHNEYPNIFRFTTTFIGGIFMVAVLPHFIMMYREKKLLNYELLKYIIKTYQDRTSFIVRNSVIYFIYYYIWSFNQSNAYFIGLSMVVAFDIVVLLNILSSSRIKTLTERFDAMPKPVVANKDID